MTTRRRLVTAGAALTLFGAALGATIIATRPPGGVEGVRTAPVVLRWVPYQISYDPAADGSLFELPPTYHGQYQPRAGIVEQQTPGGATSLDSATWVVNPPDPIAAAAADDVPYLDRRVWDADDRVRGAFAGDVFDAGASASVTLYLLADVAPHRAAMDLRAYPSLAGSITFGAHVVVPVVGGRSAAVVGPQYAGSSGAPPSDPRLVPIEGSNGGRAELTPVTFVLTNPGPTLTGTRRHPLSIEIVAGRYQDSYPYFDESRWEPSQASAYDHSTKWWSLAGDSIFAYGHQVYPTGASPQVWWDN